MQETRMSARTNVCRSAESDRIPMGRRKNREHHQTTQNSIPVKAGKAILRGIRHGWMAADQPCEGVDGDCPGHPCRCALAGSGPERAWDNDSRKCVRAGQGAQAKYPAKASLAKTCRAKASHEKTFPQRTQYIGGDRQDRARDSCQSAEAAQPELWGGAGDAISNAFVAGTGESADAPRCARTGAKNDAGSRSADSSGKRAHGSGDAAGVSYSGCERQ